MVSIGVNIGGTNIKAALVDKKNGYDNSSSVPTLTDMEKDHVSYRIVAVVQYNIVKNCPRKITWGSPAW